MTIDEGNGIYVIDDYPCHALLIRSQDRTNDERLFRKLYQALDGEVKDAERQRGEEPMMNIVSWRTKEEFLSVVFPRRRHRPACYYDEGDRQMLVSPGALDMAGLLITPRRDDFDRISAESAIDILREVSVSDDDMAAVVDLLRGKTAEKRNEKNSAKEPQVAVGIVSGKTIRFSLNMPYMAKGESIEGEQVVEFSEGGIAWRGRQYRELSFVPKNAQASFSLHDVTIGIDFHWERKEVQTFRGALRLVVEADKVCAINLLPVEEYLTSVISSEMKATASDELLKAHAVISRSWLLAQMERRNNLKKSGENFFSFVKKDDVEATRGQVLVFDGDICDARFSKCCGGVTEEFQYCWDNLAKPYLRSVPDRAEGGLIDLRVEQNARKWILDSPEAYCNTSDAKVLQQVLNDYDTETSDFYRWRVVLSQEEVARLVADKLKMDFGGIKALTVVERGRSGRISKLRIEGTEHTLTIGKELEIRRALSETHLLSSAFVVDTEGETDGLPARFILHGAGWGHGVGLCQIGAAMMGEKGFSYDQILLHYYRGAQIKKLYR